MECCSSTGSSDYEEDLENVCAILAADTVTVRKIVFIYNKWRTYLLHGAESFLRS